MITPEIEEEIQSLIKEEPAISNSKIAEKLLEKFNLDIGWEQLRKKVGSYLRENMADNEIIEENVRLAKKAQRASDTNRIERKSFREHSRVDNALSEYSQKLLDTLDNHRLKIQTEYHEAPSNKTTGIFHLTDTHFNELVDSTNDNNKFDFNVASKRCKKFVDKAVRQFRANNVDNVLFAMTGDLLNSDRRLDEMLANSTNRARATFLSVEIIENMILHLNKYFNINVASVTGNESRIQQETGWSHHVATDNYDFTIYNILDYIFQNKHGVHFIHGDPLEVVVNVGDKNILLMHGNQKKCSKEDGIQQIIGKYSKSEINIDFLLFGHIHSTWIGDHFGRGGSLVGSNDFSYKNLQLASRASQNIHILHGNDEVDSMKIDLQNVEGYEGYEITRSLEAYNPTMEANNSKAKIMEIVI